MWNSSRGYPAASQSNALAIHAEIRKSLNHGPDASAPPFGAAPSAVDPADATDRPLFVYTNLTRRYRPVNGQRRVRAHAIG
jgi:hypothetical protein